MGAFLGLDVSVKEHRCALRRWPARYLGAESTRPSRPISSLFLTFARRETLAGFGIEAGPLSRGGSLLDGGGAAA